MNVFDIDPRIRARVLRRYARYRIHSRSEATQKDWFLWRIWYETQMVEADEVRDFYIRHQKDLQSGKLGGDLIHVVRHAEQFVVGRQKYLSPDPILLRSIRWYSSEKRHSPTKTKV